MNKYKAKILSKSMLKKENHRSHIHVIAVRLYPNIFLQIIIANYILMIIYD